MPSNLDNKINSYAIETGVNFDQPVVAPPVQTGTTTSSLTNDWTLLGNLPVYQSNVGPSGGGGSWKFAATADGTQSRLRCTASGIVSRINDTNYSTGFWIKVNSFSPLSGTGYIAQVWAPSQTLGYGINIVNNSVTNQNTLIFTNAAGNVINLSQPLVYNTWFYVAIRRTGNNWELYFNGQLIHTETRTSSSSTATTIFWGPNGISNATLDVNISNWYISPYSTIDATAISEIWAVGSAPQLTVNYSSEPMTASAQSVDVSLKIDDIFSTTSATASALMTEPTIIVTSGNSTYVTTSIIASATFPSNISVIARKNINFTNVGTLNASAELINNVGVLTGSDTSFSATEFTASAEMIQPRVAEQPFIASALMGNHQAVTQPSYFQLVKNLNPYLYIHDGLSNPTNYGYQSGTFVRGSDLLTNQTSPFPLDMVAEAKSWRGRNFYNSNGFMTFETTNFANSFNNLLGTGNFAYEIWVNPQSFPDATGPQDDDITFSILNSEKIELTLEDFINRDFPTPDVLRYISLKIQNSVSTKIELTTPLDASPLDLFNWNHIVINVYQSGINANQRLVQLWINGQIVINQNISFTTWTDNTDKINYIFGSNAVGLEKLSDMFYDELAIYSAPLTNSQIIQHHNFISTLSPNYIYNASAIAVNANSGDHQFAVTSNVNAIATPITGSADFVMPSVLAQKVINYSAPALTASALNTDVTVYWGWTIYPAPAVAAAESKEGFALNTTYSDYIQANIAPYRYVTFDTATPYADFGTDNDYAVAATVLGGTIVNPDLGINGKSAKTAGLSYVTDGVILKESEHDDNWGTGNNSWHSSFWMERAIDDASTTGLRVLWNLNGHNDNQNVILYHYQNKLHLQINNQVGAPITITSANNVNVFDYTRHNIVINSHHNNNKNHLYVYVDAVLVLDQDINTYAITTINNPIHVGANDEANNFPRLGVGCLITPFVDTALPVVPTNTKLILDEIYWDKNQILQTAVTDIFNIMPDKVNANTVATALTASAEMSMPTIITNAILSAAPATASGEFVHPSLYLVRLVNVTANVMEASALMAEAIGFVQIDIAADVMAASATFNNPGVVITVPGPTMYASALLKSSGLRVNNLYPYKMLNPWVAYLRATETYRILPTREVV